MNKLRQNSGSLWQYLTSSHGVILMTYTAGFAVLALVTALIVSYISTHEAERVLVDEGQGFAQLVAQSAVIPLLTGSEENSNDFLDPLLSYQNIYHITVFDRDIKPFFSAGGVSKWMPEKNDLTSANGAMLIHEDEDHWYFASPVKTEGNDSSVVGYAFIIISKKTINTLGKNILTNALAFSAKYPTISSSGRIKIEHFLK